MRDPSYDAVPAASKGLAFVCLGCTAVQRPVGQFAACVSRRQVPQWHRREAEGYGIF